MVTNGLVAHRHHLLLLGTADGVKDPQGLNPLAPSLMTGAGRHCNKSGYAVSQQRLVRCDPPHREQELDMAAKFHLRKRKTAVPLQPPCRQRRINLTNPKLYKAKDSALGGIESVLPELQRDGAFEVKPANNGKFHFVLRPPMARSSARAARASRPTPKPACVGEARSAASLSDES